MITSSSIQYITRMLNEPRSLTDMDKESVAAIIKEYPYFVPARYMDAAIALKKKTYADEAKATMWLYMGNWLLFNDFTAAAAIAEKTTKTPEKIKFSLATATTEPEIVVTPIPVAKEPQQEVTHTIPKAQEEETVLPAQEVAMAQEAIQDIVEEFPDDAGPIAAQIVHREEEVHEEEVYEAEVQNEPAYKPEIIQPLLVKEDLVKQEEEEERTSLYVDDDEEYAPDDDLIIKPLSYTIEQYDFNKEQITNQDGDTLILPVYTDNYFFHQGIKVSDDIPEDMDNTQKPTQVAQPTTTTPEEDKAKALMVMMSFSEWMQHFKTKSQKEIEELEDKKALKSMWQQEKLAAANEEENEEIPEQVFNMAVNSITKEEDLASEALAQIHRKQGKYDRAIDMYRKLSLRNPQKIAYFALKIEELLKEKEA